MLERALALLLAAAPLAAQESAPRRLTLGDAVRAASSAPAVELAELRTEALRARIRQARAGYWPSLAIGGGWLNRTFNRASLGFDFPALPGTTPPPDLIGPFDNVDLRLRLAHPLFDWPTRARVRTARTQVTGSEAETAAVAESAAQIVALAYLRAARARALLEARRADSALAAELVTLAAAQRDAGVGTDLDVTRARTQLAVAREAIVLADHQFIRGRMELARGLGLAATAPLDLTQALSDSSGQAPVPTERERAVALALERRPDLAAERVRARAAEQSVAAIAAERLPRVELAADVGMNGPSPPAAIATRQIGVQVAIPILDGFRREGRLAEQRVLVEEADLRGRELEQEIAAQVELALLEQASVRAQGAIAAERLALADEELSQARDRFAAGVAGNIELINAQVSLLRARDADIEARFAAAAARVALARALGLARELR